MSLAQPQPSRQVGRLLQPPRYTQGLDTRAKGAHDWYINSMAGYRKAGAGHREGDLLLPRTRSCMVLDTVDAVIRTPPDRRTAL
ncbi:unnamed protein product [Peniophora sp. CBMAI 1063]|nr:unnamed protein product [Peniophora sp. CBMAI 1063]